MPKGPPLRFDITAHDRTRAAFQSVRRNADRAGRVMAAFSRTFAIGFGIGGLAGLPIAFGRATTELANLVDTADKLGVGVEFLQQFRFAAQQFGVDARTADLGLQRFTRRLGEARLGTGELQKTIEQYGIQLDDANGQARTATQILGDFAEVVSRTTNEQEALRISFKLFDSEGAALVNLLRQGRIGIEEFMERARELGIVAEETARKGKALDDRWTEVKQTFDTRFKEGVIGVADAFSWLGEKLEEARKQKDLLFTESRLTPHSFVGNSLEGMKEFMVPDDSAPPKKAADATRDAAAAGNEWTTTVEDNIASLREAEARAQSFGRTVGDAFFRAAAEGESLRDVGRDLLHTFARAGINAFAGNLFSDFSFGGARASGGPVSAGTSYLVGERGPEMFTPRTSGSIVPGAGGVGVPGTLNINVTVSGARGNMEIREMVAAGVQSGLRQVPDIALSAVRGARTRQPLKYA